mgnify:CR=1 FL=1
MIKISKYEFDSKDQADSMIAALGVDENGNQTHTHSIVKIGYIVTEKAEYDSEGVMITEPVRASKYSVDVLWNNLESHPSGWGSYALDLDTEGVHSFMGVSYIKNKL